MVSSYKYGDIYLIYRKVDNRFMGEVKVTEVMCQNLFDRMVFFKYSLKRNEYVMRKK